MHKIEIGSIAPDFALPNGDGKTVSLKEHLGSKNIIVYFYPKNNTSGCTKESLEFQEYLSKFADLDTIIIGISKDADSSHLKFRQKHGLEFNTASDIDEVCEQYGVWVEKSMYGKKYMGIERSTFVIDKEGKIIQLWRKVKVTDHVANVYNYISEN